MCKKKTTEQFIEDAKLVHGDKYDYSLVEYSGNKNKVRIICKTHGEFEQTPNNHLKNKGCKNCHYDKVNKIKHDNLKKKIKPVINLTETFIKKSEKVHGDLYDYSLVEYKSAKIKVDIICKKHGVFKQSPTNHLSGYGCMACARILQADSKRITTEEFIKRAKEKHGDTYKYEKTNYIESTKKVVIECSIHGQFKQIASAHLAGKGCEKCAMVNSSFIRENYIKMAKNRPTILYVIRCSNDNEEFYKIGKTYHSVKIRYGKNKMPYNYEVLFEYISNPEHIFNLEIETHKKYTMYNYRPEILFQGYTECYNLNLPIEEIKKL